MKVISLAIWVSISFLFAFSANAEKTWTTVENMNCKFMNPKPTLGEKVYWLGDCSDSGIITGIGKLIFYINGRPIEGHLFDFTNGTADNTGVSEQYLKEQIIHTLSIRKDWYEQAKFVVFKDGKVIAESGGDNMNIQLNPEVVEMFNDIKARASKKVKRFCAEAQKWNAPRDVIETGYLTCRNFGY